MTTVKAPEDLYYWVENGDVVEHIWLRAEGDDYFMGLTQTGVEIIGDVVALASGSMDGPVKKGDPVITLESSKWVGPLTLPFDAQISESNIEVLKNPSLLNKAPFDTWVVKLRPTNGALPKSLATGKTGAERYVAAACRNISS
jgi:glycine cleavage system H protein